MPKSKNKRRAGKSRGQRKTNSHWQPSNKSSKPPELKMCGFEAQKERIQGIVEAHLTPTGRMKYVDVPSWPHGGILSATAHIERNPEQGINIVDMDFAEVEAEILRKLGDKIYRKD